MKLTGTPHIIVRWMLFIPARALDLFAILMYALYTPYFLLKVRKTHGVPIEEMPFKETLASMIDKAKTAPVNEHGFMAGETHALMCQSGVMLFNKAAREDLCEKVIKPSGTVYRRYPDDEHHLGPSGDCIASVVFNMTLCNVQRPDLVRRLATHYLKYCFGILWEAQNAVSARSSNGGVSVTAEGWPAKKLGFGLAQPTTGPSFFTGQALMALAAKQLGGVWHIIYFLHWILLGGWFFSLVPLIYLKKELWYYTHHITANCLWVLATLRGGPLYRHALRFVVKYIAPGGNMQPFLAAVAWNAGALDYSDRMRAIKTLKACYPQTWPQHCADGPGFFEAEKNSTNYSMVGFAALLLSSEKHTKFE